MRFGEALLFLRQDKRVARAGWNGKGMWLVLICGWRVEGDHPLFDCLDNLEMQDWIGMKTADNKFVPWLASQTDLLAEDWTPV